MALRNTDIYKQNSEQNDRKAALSMQERAAFVASARIKGKIGYENGINLWETSNREQ